MKIEITSRSCLQVTSKITEIVLYKQLFSKNSRVNFLTIFFWNCCRNSFMSSASIAPKIPPWILQGFFFYFFRNSSWKFSWNSSRYSSQLFSRYSFSYAFKIIYLCSSSILQQRNPIFFLSSSRGTSLYFFQDFLWGFRLAFLWKKS